MSILGVLTGDFWVWTFGILSVGGISIALYFFFSRENQTIPGGIITSVFTVVIFLLYTFSCTHFITAINEKSIVIDWTRGKLIGTYTSGLNKKPFFSKVINRPSNPQMEVGITYAPSVKGGYEINCTFTLYVDASKVDWGKQYTRYGMEDFEDIKRLWHNKTKTMLADIVKACAPQEITENRAKIQKLALDAFKTYFDSEEIPLVDLQFVNWDFSDQNIKNAFNNAVKEQTQKATAQANLDASDIQIQTMEKMAAAKRKAIDILGLEDQNAISNWLIIQYLNEHPNSTQNIILNIGGGSVSPAIPMTGKPSTKTED